MRSINVLLGDQTAVSYLELFRRGLGEGFDFIVPRDFRTAAVVSLAKDIDVFVGSYISDAVVENAPNLRLVQADIAGTDTFNLDLLRRRNVVLCSSHENNVSVAEHALALVLASGRHIVLADRKLREGYWSVGFGAKSPPHSCVNGKTVGLIGFGNIGQAFVRLSKGLGFKILAIKRRKDEVLRAELDIDFLGTHDDMGYVLANSDFVIVALPKTRDTENLIGQAELRQMRPHAFFIQVGRADTINEEALYTACKEKWIAGAAIDTWYHYPPPEPCYPSRFPFQELDNVIMTPHCAAWTKEAVDAQMEFVVANLRRFKEGKPLENVVDFDLGY